MNPNPEILRELALIRQRLDALERTPAPRLIRREAAAKALAMDLRTFERRVQRDLRLVRSGRMRLVPVAEIDRWVAKRQDR